MTSTGRANLGPNIVEFRSQSGPNWVVVPGGPGLGPTYLANALIQSGVSGSIFGFELPHSELSQSASQTKLAWETALVEALKSIPKALVVSHSFGGMLVLGASSSQPYIEGLVLISTSPSKDWEGNIAKFDPSFDGCAVKKTEQEFVEHPTQEGLRRLYQSWAPYYFPSQSQVQGRRYLFGIEYSPVHHLLGGHFLSTYKAQWSPLNIPCALLGGAEDKLTPLNLFNIEDLETNPDFFVHSVPSAGHFPWVENADSFNQALRRFEEVVLKRPSKVGLK